MEIRNRPAYLDADMLYVTAAHGGTLQSGIITVYYEALNLTTPIIFLEFTDRTH